MDHKATWVRAESFCDLLVALRHTELSPSVLQYKRTTPKPNQAMQPRYVLAACWLDFAETLQRKLPHKVAFVQCISSSVQVNPVLHGTLQRSDHCTAKLLTVVKKTVCEETTPSVSMHLMT